MNYKRAANLLVGDRELPLEADSRSDITLNHPLVGKKVEVSPVAGGDFSGLIGEVVIVTGVILRYGQLVGLQVSAKGKKAIGSLKDFYIHRDVLEDVQPPTAISISVRECIKHYGQQRDYWLPYIDGIEAFCFELASCAPVCEIGVLPTGFVVNVPEPQKKDVTTVIGTVVAHNNFYTMNTVTFPRRGNSDFVPGPEIEDHWLRTYYYTEQIVSGLLEHGFPWEKQLKKLQQRRLLVLKVVRPLLTKTLPRVLDAVEQVTGEKKENVYLEGVSIGLSEVRLRPGTIGLNEPPTDRRPYTVITIGPNALDNEDPAYLQQVVLHECIHLCVANVHSEEPHNKLFIQIANMLGLDPEYQD